MSSSDLVSFVLVNLKRMKLKVSLTVLGVVVGTTAIVAMIALGIGLQQSVSKQFLSTVSLNDLTVLPSNPNKGGPFSAQVKEVHLDSKLIKEISGLDGVKSVIPQIDIGNVSVKIQNYKATSVSIHGFSIKSPIEIAKGRLPRRDDSKSIIISNKFGSSFEGKEKVPDSSLVNKRALLKISRTTDDGSEEVRRIRVRVAGVAKEKGTLEDYGSIYMPVELAEDIWLWQQNTPNLIKKEGYNSLKVTVVSPAVADSVQKKLEGMNLFVFSMKQILDSLNTSFRVIQAVLGAIGAVALLVASIGIVNTMIMSIYERTREIGIMKAIGASNKDIIKIFLGEASVIGLAGGVGGTFLGWSLSKILSALAGIYLSNSGGGGESPTISFIVPIWLALFAITFATCIGLMAGVYPAIRAARLNPLTALRHE
ncbi:MAG TPA: FtsX-like permease family protein [Anaerolineae bacterium]|nr:FtsX-like permease family protein [Anaerolineae bacterium]